MTKFRLIQAFTVGPVTCKNEEDSSKNEGTRVITAFLPFWVYGDFFKRSGAANSSVPGRIFSNFEPNRDFIIVLVTCNKEEPIKNEEARVFTRLFPIITIWELFAAIEIRVLLWSGPNRIQTIPHPNNAPDEMWLWLASWSKRYLYLYIYVLKCERTYGHTPGCRLESYPISSLGAFGSGELIKHITCRLNTLKGWIQSRGGIVGAEWLLALLGVVHMWLQCFDI